MHNFYKNKSLKNLTYIFNNILYYEEWVKIIGYNDVYEISTFGRIKSLARDIISKNGKFIRKAEDKIMCQATHSQGYKIIALTVDGIEKSVSVHRLVAINWIPNPMGLPEVNHINGIKNDNFFKSLEWVSTKDNLAHSYKIGIRKQQKGNLNPMFGKTGFLNHKSKTVIQKNINGEVINIFGSVREASRITGSNYSSISANCLGKQKKHNGYIWEYENKQ